MLVLSRKQDQCIVINGNISITIVEIRGDKVRLGIVAPDDVPIVRDDANATEPTAELLAARKNRRKETDHGRSS